MVDHLPMPMPAEKRGRRRPKVYPDRLFFKAGVLGLLVLVMSIDVVVFRWAKQVSAHLDESRMLVTEKVFGFLLAALAVQLALDGLSDLGVIHLAGH